MNQYIGTKIFANHTARKVLNVPTETGEDKMSFSINQVKMVHRENKPDIFSTDAGYALFKRLIRPKKAPKIHKRQKGCPFKRAWQFGNY